MSEKETLIPISLTDSYCSSWGVWEVCREFLANALDADSSCSYEVDDDTLIIKSNGGTIPYEYLLMGGGSKSVDDSNIGQHNEGSKVAMVVALREGLDVTIRNGDQLWIPELHYSELFKTEHLHVRVVDEENTKGYADVEVSISGLSEEDIKVLYENFIYFQEDLEMYNTTSGDILLDGHMKGYIFVGGMFVCVDKSLSKGYNFNPDKLKLDRDRSLARTWDIVAITDNMLAEMSNSEDHVDVVVQMIQEDCPDVQHLTWHTNSVSSEVVENLYDSFVKINGEDAIVAESYDEQTKMRNSGYKKVIFTGNEVAAKLIKRSPKYRTMSTPVVIKTSEDYLDEFLTKYNQEMSSEMYNAYEDMANNIKQL